MDGWTVLAATLVLGMVLAPAVAPPAPLAANPAAPRIFLSADASYAVAGDNVTLDVSTYLGGNLTDAAGLPQISASSPPFGVDVSTVAHVGTGRYRASIALPAAYSTALQTQSTATVTATATVGGSAVSTQAGVPWITPGLYIRLYSDIATVRPVQPMRLTAELFNGTRPVDADAGTMRFWSVGYLGARAGPMTPNRTATGVYEADVVLNTSVAFGFVANATVGGILVTAQLTSEQGPPYVPYSGFNPGSYQGWFQSAFSNATRVRGTFWVADAWGTPAPGVAVLLEFESLVTRTVVYANGTTDARGRLPVDVTLPAPWQLYGVIGQGTPQATPVFATPGSACLGSPPLPNTGFLAADPATMPDGSLRDFLTPAATVVRAYHVPASWTSGRSTSLPDAPLNYYLVGGSGDVYAAGHAVTDANGNFSLTFTVPPEDFAVQLDIAGFSTLPVLVDYAVASPEMGLRVSPLALGGPTEITTTFSATAARWVESERPMAFAMVGLVASSNGTWSKWAPSVGCALDSLRENPDGLNATLFLPSFLPASGRYLVYAWVPSARLTTQFLVLSPGQSASIPVGGPGGSGLGDLVPWLALGVIVGAVAALAVALYLRRRSPKRPAAPPPGP